MSNIEYFTPYQQISQNKANIRNIILTNYSNKGLMNYLNKTRNKNLNNKSQTCKTKTSNNSINTKIRNITTKMFELKPKKIEENKNDSKEKKDTSKIDYRHYKNYPIKDIIPLKNIKNDDKELYWLVTYDKLIKSKNIIKMLNSNNFNDKNGLNKVPLYSETSLKTKTMIIANFELFYVEGYDKPFVKPNMNQNSFIFAKLYLLTLKEINKILNFINRTEDKVNMDKYIPLAKKNSFEYIDFENITNTNFDINYPYCYIYYLGKYMNISMFLFTNTFNYIKTNNKINNNENDNDKSVNILYSLPNSKKLYKLIKILIKSFPEYNPEYIVNHIINNNLYSNSKVKMNEILKYLSLLKHSVPNKLLLNKVLRETIKGIQTNSSHSQSSNPLDSGDQIKTTEKIINTKKMSKPKLSSDETKIHIPVGFKNSINSNLFLNGQYGSNYISTNYSIVPNNSIKTYSFKNSIINNAPIINFPCENNNIRNDVKEKLNINNKNLIPNGKYIPKKVEPKKKSTNNIIKNFNINEEKENIDINNLLNKKKEKNNLINSLGWKKNANNNNDGLFKIKKNGKKKELRNESKNKYHTPKKRKKIKYYK